MPYAEHDFAEAALRFDSPSERPRRWRGFPRWCAAAPLVGSQLTNAPKQKLNLWTRYDVPSGAFSGTGVGFGLTHVSDQAGNLPTSVNTKVLRLPAYAVADLVVYYRVKAADFTLKVGNVFDRTYHDSVGSTLADLSVVPGAPRSITASMRLAF